MTTPDPVRVLIVDDSSTARYVLAQLCHGDPALEVVGEARNGDEAVLAVKRLRPSIVLMDLHMPGMDGFEATKQIMIEAPTPVIVISASYKPLDVEAALRTTEAGAVTVLPKPPSPQAPGYEREAARFLAKVRTLAEVKVIRRYPPRRAQTGRMLKPRPAASQPLLAVGIAASTGGPAALHRLLEALPGSFGAPVFVVQHIAPGFIDGLVRWLQGGTAMHVKLAEHGEQASSGTVYIAPDGAHLTVGDGQQIQLGDHPQVDGFRPSGTVLFESLAAAWGSRAAAVVLTGMGTDGLAGTRTVRASGGWVVAQDQASSVVFGMPGAVIAAGHAQVTGDIEEIAAWLTQVT